jgi:hypothetical protein
MAQHCARGVIMMGNLLREHDGNMAMTDILRWGLLLGCGGMLAIALFYLYQRQLKWWKKLLWGALAIALPLLGPFLVIYSRPGENQVHPGMRRSRMRWNAPSSSQGVRRVR